MLQMVRDLPHKAHDQIPQCFSELLTRAPDWLLGLGSATGVAKVVAFASCGYSTKVWLGVSW